MELLERGGEPFVARVWASRKIGVLMEQIRRSGPDPEVIDAIVELSLRYGIVTPYTAYLVEEPAMEGEAMQALPGVPASASPSGVGGGPVDMAPAARAYAEDAAESAAMMPASGAEAVAASEAQNSMQTATAVENSAQAQFVDGKTFVQQGWVTGADGLTLPFWVDTAFTQSMNLSWVEFASDAYFNLTQQPQMAEWLAVGQEMVIVISDTQAIRVTTNVEEMERQGGVPMSPLPTPSAQPDAAPSAEDEVATTSEPEEQSAWEQFWSWLWGN
jgi:Ca-activated chloride channel family protein